MRHYMPEAWDRQRRARLTAAELGAELAAETMRKFTEGLKQAREASDA